METKLFAQIYPTPRRNDQGSILPGAIKALHLSPDIIRNTQAVEDSFSLANGATATITTTISSEPDPDSRLAATPFMLAMYEGTKTTDTLIPFGASITTGRYSVVGPIAQPEVDPGGTDSNNTVYKTSISNNSGSLQTIIFVVQMRFIRAGGGVSG